MITWLVEHPATESDDESDNQNDVAEPSVGNYTICNYKLMVEAAFNVFLIYHKSHSC